MSDEPTKGKLEAIEKGRRPDGFDVLCDRITAMMLTQRHMQQQLAQRLNEMRRFPLVGLPPVDLWDSQLWADLVDLIARSSWLEEKKWQVQMLFAERERTMSRVVALVVRLPKGVVDTMVLAAPYLADVYQCDAIHLFMGRLTRAVIRLSYAPGVNQGQREALATILDLAATGQVGIYTVTVLPGQRGIECHVTLAGGTLAQVA